MKKPVPVLLLVVGVVLIVFGFMKMQDSGASVSMGDMEISATDEGARTQSYVLIGLGVAGLLAGGVMLRKK